MGFIPDLQRPGIAELLLDIGDDSHRDIFLCCNVDCGRMHVSPVVKELCNSIADLIYCCLLSVAEYRVLYLLQ